MQHDAEPDPRIDCPECRSVMRKQETAGVIVDDTGCSVPLLGFNLANTGNGTGTGAINGLAVSRNIRDTSATSIDSDSGGNSRVNFNCANTAAPQLGGYTFGLVKGTYRELAD